MTFRARGGVYEQLSDVLVQARAIARGISSSSQSMRDHTAAGDVSARGIAMFMHDLSLKSVDLARLKAVPGIVQYAKDQYADAAYDIAAEFTVMQAAVASAVNWLSANLPTDGRWLQMEEIVEGLVVQRMLTSAQTAGLRTELDALIATID